MDFLDDFELEDNAAIGAIAGFVEESLEEKQTLKKGDIPEEPDYNVSEENVKNDRLRLLYNQNPNFALHIVNRFLEHKKAAKINIEFMAVMAEIEDEINQMREEKENADKNGC